ncbi:UPF0501 protein KIAA1430-like Protein [Tribolium castaneum]|uniref:UPF0501 protein KIAA1430-like Protein n=1 Tax=Tribolium castaneum TaxID=7070 RepID=D1ZZW6_TRICA|nr:PREDICTED: cilia- and flagella-associated protein 97 [Tribolium castaneum]EFA02430.2 UPF0501 protein KIAA1430-like Protein [Tribolium castaneum]|eukprot:XP_008192161.1 PREDICTED: cilia- and flagella-associated protein 97 [Tribolium castaneum]
MSSKQDALSNTSADDDDVSDKAYENETFEEDSREDDSYEEMSQSTLEQLRDSHKARTFPNKTFTSSQIREIERQNTILMNKILTYNRKPSKPKVTLPNRYHPTSAAINRKKNQKKIDWENQILLRKSQTVKPSIKY